MLLWALLLGRATALTFGVCGGRMCKQKYQAWKSRKEPGKGLEVGRVVPKWIPGDDYCTLLERVEACGRDDGANVRARARRVGSRANTRAAESCL